MSLFEKMFGAKPTSASIAKDRLVMTLAHERAGTTVPDMDEMKKELIQVIRKYVKVRDITIKSERNHNIDMLEIDVSIGS